MDRISMTPSERWGSVARGATAGLVAGTVFAAAEMAASTLGGYGASFAARMAASIWLGPHAFTGSIGTVFLIGAVLHYAISMAWGVAGAVLYEWAEWPTRNDLGVAHSISLGALFGMVVWLVDMAVVAGNFLPWIWRAHQPSQFLLHALFFGLPLGVTVAALARLAPEPALRAR